MLSRDWILCIFAVLVWGGTLAWYLFPEMLAKWRMRDAKWFREPR